MDVEIKCESCGAVIGICSGTYDADMGSLNVDLNDIIYSDPHDPDLDYLVCPKCGHKKCLNHEGTNYQGVLR